MHGGPQGASSTKPNTLNASKRAIMSLRYCGSKKKGQRNTVSITEAAGEMCSEQVFAPASSSSLPSDL